MTAESTSTADGPGPPRTAIQLHTLASMSAPLETVVRRVAAAGYDGVEFAGRFLETDPEPVRTALAETGIEPVAAHVGLSRLETDPKWVIDRCLSVGCRRVVVPHVGAGHFRTTARVDVLAGRLAELSDLLAPAGIELTYHNTLATLSPPLDRFGLGRVSAVPLPGGWRRVAAGLERATGGVEAGADRTALGRLIERTPEAVTFEIDVGWVAAAGYDPVAVMELLGERLAVVHVADVEATGRFLRSFAPVTPGEGLVDLERVLPAARSSGADWLVFENDDPADPEQSIRQGVRVLSQHAGGQESRR
ncbi:sugar phosphate isomerase/epimerase family protein [Natronomonas marina]|jgi:sugar phosphate isomerase/epimerase|uniref:sugar phosphate isomerase/epimerase family protein n=1 Tax=Natronomonas marina TaxID=2961939 RepID=UPI0020C94232|nr:sugar phosphate isomerase/epimerase [Natronomonas marina]